MEESEGNGRKFISFHFLRVLLLAFTYGGAAGRGDYVTIYVCIRLLRKVTYEREGRTG